MLKSEPVGFSALFGRLHSRHGQKSRFGRPYRVALWIRRSFRKAQ